MKQLKVILQGNEVGCLEQGADGRIAFSYKPEWLANSEARPLSQSLPLQSQSFNERECISFFGGLLPEEHNREVIARNLGITARNDFALLKEIGGECAGSVTLIPVEANPEPESNRYEAISESDLIRILDQLPQRPLLAGKSEIRLSLAGAQNKVALKLDASGYAIPLHEAPSTHILKPEIERFPGLVENEAYCLQLAAEVGLTTCKAEAKQFGPHKCLLVQRYDRIQQDAKIHRLHQEDFCQALGIPSRTKYQTEGGPGLSECFQLIRKVSANPARDLLQLSNAVLFNYLIGNNDAHGKNFSLLYSAPSETYSTRLAPFYDLICTACYPELSAKMAMKIGKSYLPSELRIRDWDLYWEAIGFSATQARRQALQFIDRLNDACQTPQNETQTKVQQVISDHSMSLRSILSSDRILH
ncbi:type II toxin-antitoxin system HipA family toxin [Coraliomargarita parva]|uniref:type II toxin-antitoxin system HipA family toxin n=1 Tax=Coraliomargarita parva TaxID=3014050 RepID=UPI0022B4F1B4|nr:type II toxin-antitoxin system HipA family toxin [Coraliomargarita parva]